MTNDLKGIFAALTTPFVDDEISPERFRDNIDRYNSHELAGYVVAGSTGESVYLTDEECLTLIRTAREAAPDRTLIAGTARESTRKTIDFTNRAAGLGADAALVVLPHYYKSAMTSSALEKHFVTIADNSEIPIIIYSIPRNTGIIPEPKVIISLSHHPQIAGIKDSSGNLTLLQEAFPEMAAGSAFLLGAGSIMIPGLLMGAGGGILTLAAVAPEMCVRLYALFQEEKWEEARDFQMRLVPLNQAVTRDYGVPGAKFALDQRGYYGGPSRLPLQPLEEAAKDHIRDILTGLELT